MYGRFFIALFVTSMIAACTTTLRAPELLIFVSPAGEVVASSTEIDGGEVLLRMENRGDETVRLAIARLDPGVERLPTVEGAVPIGDAGDVTYRGDGYRVLAKGDTLRRFISGRGVSKQVIHPYIRRGTHVVFDTVRGRYDDGAFVTIEAR